jgi:small subunit ribosomal protein S2
MNKMKRNLSGIKGMDKLPGALVVIDTKRELSSIKEARKLGIPTVCLIDTDGDPELADIAIPGNDDSMRSIDVVVRELCLAIAEGKQARQQTREGDGPAPAGDAGDRGDRGDRPDGDRQRRSRRSQYRADDQPASAPEGTALGPAPAKA